MPSRDLHHRINVIETFTTATVTADQDGTGVDYKSYEATEHLIVMGNSGDTLSGSVFIELVLQDSPDDSAWTDVDGVADPGFALVGADDNVVTPSATGVFATINAPAEDSRVFRIGYVGPQRYSRVQIDVTGTHTNGTPIGMCAIRWRASLMPTSGPGV